jgi:hypothetical protein
MKRVLTTFMVVMVSVALSAVHAIAADNPVITLERVEVASIQPFFVKPKIMVPSKDDPEKKVEQEMTYGYSSIMNIAYVLNVKNPGKTPIMLDELSFTILFEGFEVNTVTSYDDVWVCPGKANQLRVLATNEAFPMIVSLSLGAEAVTRIQEMKTSAGALVGKWFNTISDFSFPIEVTNGNAVFKTEKGEEVRVNFAGKFGKAAEPAKKEEKKAEKKEEKKEGSGKK